MKYICSNDGTKIAVYDWNPCGCPAAGRKKPSGCRGTVLLVHGWPLSHEIYEYQLQPLLDCGYRVVAVDLRGFGKSDAPACRYGYDQMADDLHCVVRELGLSCFTLVGFSMGGAISLRYMRRHRGQGVKKLILLAAAAPCWTQRPGYADGMTQEYVDEMICLARTDRPQLCENFSGQLFACPQSMAVIEWFRDIALSASGIGTVQALISLRDEDGRNDLPCVHVPTVIIHGAKDQVVSGELAELQHRGIKCSRLVTLDNSGHGIMYDELQRFNQVFLEALAK